MQLKITGTKDLVGKLKDAANLNDVKRTLLMNGTEMQNAMQRDAPVDTGFLKGNISLRTEDDGLTVIVTPEAHYATYLIYGTRFMHARDFFRPNFFKQRQKFLNDLKRLMK